MKSVKRSAWMLVLVLFVGVILSLNHPMAVQAAMADEAEDYELGETYSGYEPGSGSDYYKFNVTEKSHLSFDMTSSDGYGSVCVYNSGGREVIKSTAFSFEYDNITGIYKVNTYRVVEPGTYYIEFFMKYHYTFKITAEKQINLTKGILKSVKSKTPGQMTISWKTTPDAIGYSIQYSTNEQFKTGVKTVTTGDASKTITKLKKGKRYYIRVAPYTVYEDGTYVYGQYSLPKTVKIKK